MKIGVNGKGKNGKKKNTRLLTYLSESLIFSRNRGDFIAKEARYILFLRRKRRK